MAAVPTQQVGVYQTASASQTPTPSESLDIQYYLSEGLEMVEHRQYPNARSFTKAVRSRANALYSGNSNAWTVLGVCLCGGGRACGYRSSLRGPPQKPPLYVPRGRRGFDCQNHARRSSRDGSHGVYKHPDGADSAYGAAPCSCWYARYNRPRNRESKGSQFGTQTSFVPPSDYRLANPCPRMRDSGILQTLEGRSSLVVR